jgi:hypothetical protein
MGDHRLGSADDARPSVRILTRTLDSYWGQTIPKVDVLKMDVQGAEGLVLKGMSQTVLNSPKLKIFMEFWPHALLRCGTNPKDLVEEFMALGFSIQIIDQERGKLLPMSEVEELLVCKNDETSFDLYLER